jgi:hypothetical protein
MKTFCSSDGKTGFVIFLTLAGACGDGDDIRTSATGISDRLSELTDDDLVSIASFTGCKEQQI